MGASIAMDGEVSDLGVTGGAVYMYMYDNTS